MPHIQSLHWIIFQQSKCLISLPPIFFGSSPPASKFENTYLRLFLGKHLGCRSLFFSMATGMGFSHWKDVSVFIYNYNHEKKDPWLFRAFVGNDTTQFFMGIISHACIRTSWKQTVNAPEKHWGCGFRPRTCDICPNGKSVGLVLWNWVRIIQHVESFSQGIWSVHQWGLPLFLSPMLSWSVMFTEVSATTLTSFNGVRQALTSPKCTR